MSDNIELKYLKSLLETEEEKEILDWLSKELTPDQIVKQIIKKSKK